MSLKNDRYTYRVTWSEDDSEYVGLPMFAFKVVVSPSTLLRAVSLSNGLSNHLELTRICSCPTVEE
jgi:hypothetical protein